MPDASSGMKTSSFQFAVARSVSLAGATVAALIPLLYLSPDLPVIQFDRGTALMMRYLLVTWGVPAALCLILGGYLLRPRERPMPRTRLFVPLRVGITGALWGLGMLAMTTPILIALVQAVRLMRADGTLPAWETIIFKAYILHFAFFPTGVLCLLAARKWWRDTELPP